MKSYGYTVINHAIVKAANMDADILQGELVHIDAEGKATNKVGTSSFALPAVHDIKFDSKQNAEVRLIGAIAVKVSDFTNIVAGSPLTIGDDFKGVKVAGTGEFQIGIALQKPTANGQFISCFINPVAKAANLY